MKRSELQMKVKTFRERIEEASQTLPDDLAQFSVALYPHWDESAHYDVNYRVQYNDTVYKCLQAHDAQQTWTPTDAHSLWGRVHLEDVIEDWVQPDMGEHQPYMTGDKVRYNGKIYESLIDNNVWSPDAYPQGWKLLEE